VKQQALDEAYARRGYKERVPEIHINESPESEASFRFLWMEMALGAGYYANARKNAWLGFTNQPLSYQSIKGLLLGFGGPLTKLARRSLRTIRQGKFPPVSK
jgi:hypothetical protein